MAFQTLGSGYWLLRWPYSWSEWDSFLAEWGMTPDAAVRALLLGHFADQLLGLRVWILSGRRDTSEQQALWDERATRPWPVAPPGTSRHERGEAFDVGFDYALSPTEWERIGNLGRQLGLRWGGDFSTPDRPHFDLG